MAMKVTYHNVYSLKDSDTIVYGIAHKRLEKAKNRFNTHLTYIGVQAKCKDVNVCFYPNGNYDKWLVSNQYKGISISPPLTLKIRKYKLNCSICGTPTIFKSKYTTKLCVCKTCGDKLAKG